MISIVMLVSVAVLLAFALGAARSSRLHQVRLQRENRTLQLDLERHREAAHSILRELQNP